MIVHVLGYGTLASQFVVAVGALYWLTRASRESRTWLRKLPVPKFAATPIHTSSGTDYVGLI